MQERPAGMQCLLHSPFSPSFAVCAASATTTSAPRPAWRSPRRSRATRPSLRSSPLPCHRTHSPVRQAPRACTLPAPALFTFRCRVRSLRYNELGPAAGIALAEVLKGNTTLTYLRSAALPSGTHSPVRHGRTSFTFAALALFTLLLPCAQPRRQQTRPRSWYGARRGPQGQHDPHVARVCCPAISNPLARASQPHSVHVRCTRPFHLPFAVCAASLTTASAPRKAW